MAASVHLTDLGASGNPHAPLAIELVISEHQNKLHELCLFRARCEVRLGKGNTLEHQVCVACMPELWSCALACELCDGPTDCNRPLSTQV